MEPHGPCRTHSPTTTLRNQSWKCDLINKSLKSSGHTHTSSKPRQFDWATLQWVRLPPPQRNLGWWTFCQIRLAFSWKLGDKLGEVEPRNLQIHNSLCTRGKTSCCLKNWLTTVRHIQRTHRAANAKPPNCNMCNPPKQEALYIPSPTSQTRPGPAWPERTTMTQQLCFPLPFGLTPWYWRNRRLPLLSAHSVAIVLDPALQLVDLPPTWSALLLHGVATTQ